LFGKVRDKIGEEGGHKIGGHQGRAVGKKILNVVKLSPAPQVHRPNTPGKENRQTANHDDKC